MNTKLFDQKHLNDKDDNIQKIFICVSFEDALLKSDLFWEVLQKSLRVKPSLIIELKEYMNNKKDLFDRLVQHIDPTELKLPFNKSVLTYLNSKKLQGAQIDLLSCCSKDFTQKIVGSIDVFSNIYTLPNEGNLSQDEKLNFLNIQYGSVSYEYIGSKFEKFVSLEVKESKSNIDQISDISNGNHFLRMAHLMNRAIGSSIDFCQIIKAMRVHQWAKNVLVFLPMLAAHSFDINMVVMLTLAFLSLSLCSSGTYLLNDLVDLYDDRSHYSKCNRPFAAGDLSLKYGFFMAPLLKITGLAIAYSLSVKFFQMLIVFCCVTQVYSFYLKRFIVIDVIILAFLYLWRILCGSVVSHISVSPWLLAFSILFFYSLALAKRSTELFLVRKSNGKISQGRGYSTNDIDLVNSIGVASGIISGVMLGVYFAASSTNVLYSNLNYLWPVCVLFLLWISRIWVITGRGELLEDIIVYIVKDKFSYFIFFLSLILITLAK